MWSKLWKSHLHERLKIFLWRVLAEVMPTRENLNKFFSGMDACCAVCGWESESVFHLFKECPGIGALTFSSRWGGIIDDLLVINVFDLIGFCLQPHLHVCLGELDTLKFTTFVASLLYCFWNFRNDMGGSLLDQYVTEFSSILQYHSNTRLFRKKEGWSSPFSRWWKVNCDAAFVNGKAALVMVVRDDDGFLCVL